MITLSCYQPSYFDVDDTLVKFGYQSSPIEGSIEVVCGGFRHYLMPHKRHIEQLKAHKARGHTIIVWSQGGHQWAEAVVMALGLRDFVDLVLEKPQWAYDDKQAEEFIKTIWYKDE